MPNNRKHDIQVRLLMIQAFGDFLFAVLGLIFSYYLRFQSPLSAIGREGTASLTEYFPLIATGAGLLLAGFAYLGLYRWRTLINVSRASVIIAKGVTFWFFAFLLVSLALKFEPSISRFFVMISWVCVLLSVLSWRYFLHRLFARLDILKKIERRILLVGWSDEAETLVNAVRRTESHPYTLHGCVMTRNDDESTIAQSIGRNLPILGKLAELETIIKRDRPEMVVVLDLDLSREDLLQVAHLCEVLYVEFKVAPSMFQTFESGLHLETIAGFPVLGVADLPINQLHGLLLKRTVDIVGALVGLSLAAPIMAVLALLIRRESPGPVIYRQTRTGKGGRPFTIYKMRSMRLDAEATTGTVWAVKDDPRRLRIGTFMRSTNLDELPQFWNVLKGDMSLVGPRPERPELIEKFEREIPHYNPRHLVKPGITGWAQVNGLRGDTSLTERIRYDLYYIENWSVFLDFQIMVLTFFKRDNAY